MSQPIDAAGCSSATQPTWPVIGILSHPDGHDSNNGNGASHINASYVKFVMNAGAAVIPLIFNESNDVRDKKLSLVNGVLLTGGDIKSGLYYKTVREIFEKVLVKNDLWEHFPLFATCLGFELLSKIISKDVKILERFSASDHPNNLQFTDNDGEMFQRIPRELRDKLTTDCLVYHNHKWGISPGGFQNNRYLSRFFKILTTSKDKEDKEYVSTVEAKNYPVYGVQWHPEKNSFAYAPNIPRTPDARQVTQHVANFFIRTKTTASAVGWTNSPPHLMRESEAKVSERRPDAEEVRAKCLKRRQPGECQPYKFSPTG